MRSPLDYLARRLFREPFEYPLSLTRKAPIDMRRVLAKAINAEPGNGLSSLPVPATTGQRVTATELADATTFANRTVRAIVVDGKIPADILNALAQDPSPENMQRVADEYGGKVKFYPVEAMTADPTPNPALVNECVVCNPDGGKRPDTKAGREGR